MAWKSWKIWLLMIAILLASGGAYFFLRPATAIAVVHPARGPAVQAVYATGTVEPVVMLPLGPRSTGRLAALLADEGDDVAAGQILARLEDENLQKSLEEATARAELADKEYARRTDLLQRGVVSKTNADQALAERDSSRAAVERIQAELDYLKLISPEAGTIIRRDGEIGEIIPAGQPVFWLSCCAGLRIETEVDEEDIALVAPGQKVVISADAFPKDIFYGQVDSITPKGDPVSRSYRVRIGLEPETGLMIGMTAETNIVIREEKDALLVPATAVAEGKVLAIRDGKVTPVEIETGARGPEAVEVRKGLSKNDLVVLDAAQALEPGAAVETSLKKWKVP
ncbi:MAG: efflux RND transporter periplasmic adaptor subunit [Micavibrio sp.]